MSDAIICDISTPNSKAASVDDVDIGIDGQHDEQGAGVDNGNLSDSELVKRSRRQGEATARVRIRRLKLSAQTSGLYMQKECAKVWLTKIGEATRKVRVAAYCLTNRKVVDALKDVRRKGIPVYILVDEAMLKRTQTAEAAYEELTNEGCFMGTAVGEHGGGTAPQNTGDMHLKLLIIDDACVVNGSFNPSTRAEYLSIDACSVHLGRSDINIAIDEWRRVWRMSKRTSDAVLVNEEADGSSEAKDMSVTSTSREMEFLLAQEATRHLELQIQLERLRRLLRVFCYR